jgi:hypothetical protein
VKGSRAVSKRHVDVDTVGQQRPDSLRILCFGRLDEPPIGFRGQAG